MGSWVFPELRKAQLSLTFRLTRGRKLHISDVGTYPNTPLLGIGRDLVFNFYSTLYYHSPLYVEISRYRFP